MAEGQIGLFWLGSLVPLTDYWCGAALSYLTMCLAARKEKMALYNHQPATCPQPPQKRKKKTLATVFSCRTLKREQERGRRF